MNLAPFNGFTIFSQPVLQLKEEVGQQENSAIDTKTTLADIRQVHALQSLCVSLLMFATYIDQLTTHMLTLSQEPLNMPGGFEWKTIDIMDPVEAQEVYVLLRDNYVEDDDCTFRYVFYNHRVCWCMLLFRWLMRSNLFIIWLSSFTCFTHFCILFTPMQIRLLDSFPAVGAHPSRLSERMAHWSAF